MTTGIAVADWIKRIADDERKRDEARVKEEEVAARKAELVRLNGRRLVDELRATVIRDVGAFRDEFSGDFARDITLEATESEGGFVVRKPASPSVSLTVSPHLESAAVGYHYQFASTSSLPPREDRFELVPARDGKDILQMRHAGTGQLFLTAEALSEFLLVPVFTGRPR